MIRRLSVVALLAAGLAVMTTAGPAEAAGTCTRNGTVMRINGTAQGVTIDRNRHRYAVQGVGDPSCDGSTIANTTGIVVTAPRTATVRLMVNTRLGGFEPACCNDVQIDLRFRGRVVVQEVDGAAEFTATAAGIRLDAGRDFEVVGGPWRELVMNGAGGDDWINALPRVGGDYPGDLVLRGGGGDDGLQGGDGDDLLYGGPGADTLSGSSGDDTLWGGDGDDLLHVGDGDELFGGPGADGANSTLGATTFDLVAETATAPAGTAQLHSIEGAYGSNGGDTFVGDDGPNFFFGYGGDDDADGAGGDDALLGYGGGDDLVGGSGVDALDGGQQVDTCDAGTELGDAEVNCELP